MDLNGASNSSNSHIQPSIRSFFQPRSVQYSAPPASVSSRTIPPAPVKQNIAVTPSSSPLPTSNPSKGPPKTISQEATISPIEQHHIQPLRRINSLLLPISYPDSFYHNILATNLSRIILWHDPQSQTPKVIGGIVCRLDPSVAVNPTIHQSQTPEGSLDIYIQSLALLSPYREKGLASKALESVVAAAVAMREVKIRDIYAHVWTENLEALEWYVSRGFKREEPVIQGYYRRLKPDTAWILRRRLNPSDHLAHASPAPPPQKVESTFENPAVSTVQTNERPGALVHTKSFQDRRPDMEWNDLPEDVLRSGRLKPPSMSSSSAAVSASSSRSSSRSGLEIKGKKKRQYPAAAFGS